LPTADVAAGEMVFAKCKTCHTIDNGGANGTGPNQWAIVGRKPGAHAGFAYSPAMVEYGAKNPVWDFERLSEFIKNPAKDMPGTKMGFVGLKKPEDRINLLAYLNSKGGTVAFPAPNPAAAAPAAADAGAAASATDPTATGSTATPAATSGGPAGQAPTTGAAKAPTATAAQNTGSPS
ncbi:MAG: cytochrome c family protein, partial [Phenylobacterium sp.]|nr:cytochrome c family protein [Phenylobacterium sp.]